MKTLLEFLTVLAILGFLALLIATMLHLFLVPALPQSWWKYSPSFFQTWGISLFMLFITDIREIANTFFKRIDNKF